MVSLQEYISSLSKNKPSYGGLLSGLSFKTANSTPAMKNVAPTPTPIAPGSPSATSPTSPTVVNKPPTTPPTMQTQSSPAQTEYINSLIGGTSSVGSSGFTPPPTVRNTTPTPTPESAYLDSYRDYLAQYAESLKPSAEVEAARKKLADIQTTGDQTSLNARKAYEDALANPGMLKSGAQETGAALNKDNSYILANLGVAESGAARALSALTGNEEARSNALKTAMELNKPLQIGDNYYDPKTGKLIPASKAKEGFSLSEGQARYEFNPETGQYERTAIVPKTTASGSGDGGLSGGTYVPGANAVVDSWANRIQEGSAKITDIPASQAGLRSSVTVALNAMGNSPEGRPTTTELGKTALQTANDLLTKFDEGKGTSAVGKSGFLGSLGYGLLPGTARANFVTDFNALKSLLSLEGVKYLKGQGAVSDAERALLSQAVTKLNLSQSEDEFKKTLTSIIKKLDSGVITGTEGGSDVLTSPDGTQEVDISELTPEELKEAKAAGWQ